MKTAEEFEKLITTINVSDISRDENGDINSIDIRAEIAGYEEINAVRLPFNLGRREYGFILRKERSENDAWTYSLYLSFTDQLFGERKVLKYDKNNHKNTFSTLEYFRYLWMNMTQTSACEILLVSEEEGRLKELFEEDFSFYWANDHWVTEIEQKDQNFYSWINELNHATSAGFMYWHKLDKNWYGDMGIDFWGKYDDTDVKISINSDPTKGDRDLLYIRKSDGSGIRYGTKVNGFSGYRDPSLAKEEPKLLLLAKKIEDDIKKKRDNEMDDNWDTKIIKHTDVVAVTHSMVCHNMEHEIKPLRGIVQLLTDENKVIDYEIYIGYCKVCDKYYMFQESYEKMLKAGKPLCTVYYKGEKIKEKQHTPFRYRSQSVLHAMGYTVESNTNLSKEERQSILQRALESNLFQIHDLLDFLNWLIRTRESQTRYRIAVRKWKEDVAFVEDYKKNSREKINVDSITIR